MAATTTTTIRDVSIFSRQKKRGHDVFELGLSRAGIEVRRPGQAVQQMSWARVSEWELEEQEGYLLLTLRGHGATTPLVVPGWTLEDLEALLRDVTTGAPPYEPERPAPERSDGDGTTATRAASATPAPARPATPSTPTAVAAPATKPARQRPPTTKGVERRRRAARKAWWRSIPWKPVVTVVLLAALATAVVLVLLQSAGIINWSLLGPVA